jgi:hypothetical protein
MTRSELWEDLAAVVSENTIAVYDALIASYTTRKFGQSADELDSFAISPFRRLQRGSYSTTLASTAAISAGVHYTCSMMIDGTSVSGGLEDIRLLKEMMSRITHSVHWVVFQTQLI